MKTQVFSLFEIISTIDRLKFEAFADKLLPAFEFKYLRSDNLHHKYEVFGENVAASDYVKLGALVSQLKQPEMVSLERVFGQTI